MNVLGRWRVAQRVVERGPARGLAGILAGPAETNLKPRPFPDGCLTLRLDGHDPALREGQEALAEYLRSEEVDATAHYHTELAYEELVVNIAQHSYSRSRTGSCPIDVHVVIQPQEVVLTVEDDGPPFDPLRLPDPERPANLGEASIGGLGLRLVRMGAKHMAYDRSNGRNRVIVSVGRN